MPNKPSLPAVKPKKADEAGVLTTVFASFTGIMIALINAFGWAGAFLILGIYLINSWASLDQKKNIVDVYILGLGVSQRWPLFVLSIAFFMVLVAQYKWNKQDKEKLKKRIQDLEFEIVKLEVRLTPPIKKSQSSGAPMNRR